MNVRLDQLSCCRGDILLPSANLTNLTTPLSTESPMYEPGGATMLGSFETSRSSPRASGELRSRACRLCALDSNHLIWNRILWESENFCVVPSKGGFVPGWVMVVPKTHVLSVAQLPNPLYPEMKQLVAEVSARLTECFGPPTAFEHGAVVENSSFGCGVDHAHLHLVPLPPYFRLRLLAERTLGPKFFRRGPSPDRAYLSVREPSDPDFFICEPLNPPPDSFSARLSGSPVHGRLHTTTTTLYRATNRCKPL